MTGALALLAGLLFGSGLLLSEMTDPANVIAFLDVTGAWSPALAFTMGGAIAVAVPAFAYTRRHRASLRGSPIPPASRTRIDRSLLLGSAVFGVGWGLSGICPGPALVLLTTGTLQAFIFIAGVVVGTLAVRSPSLGKS
ncbi:MAG: DUF6691 family protein [Steroidobacteraceae bacterium]